MKDKTRWIRIMDVSGGYEIYLDTPRKFKKNRVELILKTKSIETLVEFVKFYGLYNTLFDEQDTHEHILSLLKN